MTENVDSPFTLAIIGAGIGGLALAIGLQSQNRSQNIKFTIYEGAPKFDAIGAGIGLGPNALKAMSLMDANFARLYDSVKMGNTSASRRNEQIEILGAEEGFGISEDDGGWKGGSVGHRYFERSSAHRRDLLEIMKSLISPGTVKFGKRVSRLRNVESFGEKKVEITFEDGELLSVDAAVGCDGIKGMTRSVVLDERFPELVEPKYLGTYVCRGITSMENAREVLGHFAEDARWWMRKGAGWAMYPISRGSEVNIVAFVQDERKWEGERSAREVTREEMLRDFEGFDKRLLKMLDYAKPSKWPLFHHPETPTYYSGRICLLGDVAHASSPSQAAGAGQGLEDALILSRLLGLVKSSDQLDAAIQVYDSIRRPRAQGIVRDSADIMKRYFLVDPEFGHDLRGITKDANQRLPAIWWYDLEGDIGRAKENFRDGTEKKKEKGVGFRAETKEAKMIWKWQRAVS